MDEDQIWSFIQAGLPGVLATVIGSEGHSYRKAGAVMVFLADGRRAGCISPGCLEEDIQARTDQIWESGIPEVVHYDMRPETDPVWGESIGCGGRLDILLEPLRPELLSALRQAGCCVHAGESCWLLRDMDSSGRISYRVVRDPVWSPLIEKDSKLQYRTRFEGKPRLIVFGAGAEAEELEPLARGIGFRTAVADWRTGLCVPERFPHAEAALGDAAALIGALGICSEDYILLASHRLQKDEEMLQQLLPLRPAYLGVIGSSRRIDLLLGGKEPPPFVRAPAGADIGAEGPREIAVSIAAELISLRRGARRRSAERRMA